MNQRILVLMKDTVSFYKSCMLMVILCVSQGCSLNIAQIGDPGLASGRWMDGWKILFVHIASFNLL